MPTPRSDIAVLHGDSNLIAWPVPLVRARAMASVLCSLAAGNSRTGGPRAFSFIPYPDHCACLPAATQRMGGFSFATYALVLLWHHCHGQAPG